MPVTKLVFDRRPRTSVKRGFGLEHVALFSAAALLGAAPPPSAPLVTLPFDFARHEIAVEVRVNGAPLHVILDTGVDPSAIDLARAEAVGLAVDRAAAGEGDGFGAGKRPTTYPATITGLTLGGRPVAPFAAMATDLGALSANYGSRLDAVLGYSFLADKVMIVDYRRHRVAISDRSSDVAVIAAGCRTHWRTRFTTIDSFPVIPFRFGRAIAPVTLDTGANGGIGLFESAFAVPRLRAALVETGSVAHQGFQGAARSTAYRVNETVGIGPFAAPAGQSALLHAGSGSTSKRVANIGNAMLSQLAAIVAFDYRTRVFSAFGDCG